MGMGYLSRRSSSGHGPRAEADGPRPVSLVADRDLNCAPTRRRLTPSLRSSRVCATVVGMCRRVARRWYLVLLLLTVSIAIPTPADACKCSSPPPPCEATWHAAAVFEGTVLAIVPVSEPDTLHQAAASFRIRVDVGTVWVGDVPAVADVYTGSGGGDCGYPFVQGRRYVIYAYGLLRQSGRLEAHICSRTRAWDEAGEDRAYLDSLERLDHAPAAGAGRVSGQVLHVVAARPGARHRPLAAQTVRIWHDAGTTAATTDEDGRYEASGVAVGTVVVELVRPDGDHGQTSSGQLRDARGWHRR
jgi:hypothetical protein